MPTYAELQQRTLSLVAPYVAGMGDEAILLARDAITYVVRYAQEQHNFRVMRTSTTLTTTAATRALGNYPSDWKEPRREAPVIAKNDGGFTEIAWIPDEMDARRRYSDMTTDKGAPKGILARATDIAVYPFSDSASDYGDNEYRILIPYYGFLTALSATTDTNWLTTNGERYITYAAAGEILRETPGQNERATIWGITEDPLERPLSIADKALKRMIKHDKLMQLDGGIYIFPKTSPMGNSKQGRL